MRRLSIFSVAVILVFVVRPALAAPTVDSFTIGLIGGDLILGDGSGYNDGYGVAGTPWYYYENTNWYNQWFYDDPPDPTRWKEISWDINIDSLAPGWVTIALNWSTLAYGETGPDGFPPLPPLVVDPAVEEMFITRAVIFDDLVLGSVNTSGTFTFPDYNPEWVSIDIRLVDGFVIIEGTITHECVPAPGAILLGSIGVGLVGWLRRRRTL